MSILGNWDTPQVELTSDILEDVSIRKAGAVPWAEPMHVLGGGDTSQESLVVIVKNEIDS